MYSSTNPKHLRSIFALSLVFLLSCKKGKQPTNDFYKLSVSFSAQTIPIAKVDSVVAVFKKRETGAISTERLTRDAGSYQLKLKAGQNKEDIVNLKVYSTEDLYSRRKYVLAKEGMVNKDEISGPIIEKRDKWIPFILLLDKQENIEITLAERQDVPLVEISFPEISKWNSIYLDRIIFGPTNHILDSEIWELSGSFKGRISNDQAFSAYCNRVKDKVWKESSVYCMVMNVDTGEDRIFNYVYPQRY